MVRPYAKPLYLYFYSRILSFYEMGDYEGVKDTRYDIPRCLSCVKLMFPVMFSV